ncbi:MAG TPA: lysogenization regulator HflD [Candidatus Tenderia electrophaga]|uniref:High frequency lysogenization protein HflD homolog n=1 Tax=Candidatus Tenderia electrophaga TaxID=1748243 RepID=A0A832J831_9GAMM|nr:lysogenization regulator HflD [Candidatus Tenderia electrophaga]
MEHTYREQVLAFAGVWQAVKLVQDIARTGTLDNDDFEACIKTLFVTDPDTTEEVYGSVQAMSLGLNTLLDQFGDATNNRDMELTKYVMSLMHLERKLEREPQVMQKIGNGIELAKSQAEHFGSVTHETVIASLAETYANTISTLASKIIDQGGQGYLSNPANAAKVRTLLLAGIRSTLLWYQCGGRRLGLLFSRNKLLKQAKQLQNETI